MHSVSVLSSCSSSKRVRFSTFKNTAVFKRSMTEKSERWQINQWYGKTKTHGSNLLEKQADTARTKSGKNHCLKASGKRSLLRLTQWETLKEQTNTWKKSCKESAKRESELYKMIELAAIDESKEHKERSMLKDLLYEVQKRREEEDEARGLIEEMQCNLDEAHARSYETEWKLDRVVGILRLF